ncbi:MAG: 16S rRNA methyltransferase [Candidatus Thorarchaeota archaeon]|jgi:rRNA small subunit pseudouridine methyltransferase Nep1
MLNIILLDCALELVPSEISSKKQIQKHATRRGKKPTELLLDQTYHGQAMIKLSESERRGRPDITFLSLMSILETPLCKEGLLGVYLHLQDGRIITVSSDVRLPRNYERFVGLMQQLLLSGRVPPKGDALLQVIDKSLGDLITDLKADLTILAIEGGHKTTIDGLSKLIPTDSSVPVIVGIGAYPHGDLSESTTALFDNQLEFDKEIMMAWHVCSEVVWTYSRTVGVIGKRYSTI